MPQRRRPKKGSRAYGPRKRAQSQTPRLDSWPEISGAPKIQGFAGYKAGMTHAFIVDKRAKATTSGMEVQVPVTVLEVPPMKVAAVRFYENTIYGLKTAGEVWAQELDPLLDKRLNVPKSHDEASFAKYDGVDVDDGCHLGHVHVHIGVVVVALHGEGHDRSSVGHDDCGDLGELIGVGGGDDYLSVLLCVFDQGGDLLEDLLGHVGCFDRFHS